MLIRKRDYYDKFQCLAGACPDSCCKEWEIQVNDNTAKRYRNIKTALGYDLRQALKKKNGRFYLALTPERRCPMWREDGLCRIHAELGEEALCKTCREYPRLRHDYGTFQELGLELSCPEAARLILSAEPAPMIEEEIPGTNAGDYDEEDMKLLLSTRETAYALLSDTTRPIGETLAILLLYGYLVQSVLDGEEDEEELREFDADLNLDTARMMATRGSIYELFDFLLSLEILTDEWTSLLSRPRKAPWDSRTLAFARYLTDRYWLQAISDYDLCNRVKFLVIACITLRYLDGDFLRCAQLFSKELENNRENMFFLLDIDYECGELTDEMLLGLLLMNNL